jgi:hypothetical protein
VSGHEARVQLLKRRCRVGRQAGTCRRPLQRAVVGAENGVRDIEDSGGRRAERQFLRQFLLE